MTRLRCGGFVAAASGIVLLALSGLVESQQIPGKDKVKAAWNSTEKYRGKLLRGELSARDMPKEARETAHAFAEWYIFRVGLPTFRADPAAFQNFPGPDWMELLFKDLDSNIDGHLNYKDHPNKNRLFAEMLAEEMVKASKLVLKFRIDADPEQRKGLVYLGQMFPRMGKTRQDAVTAFFLDLLKDPNEYEFIKLYALKGLAEVGPVHPVTLTTESPKKDFQQKKALDMLRVKVLTDFLDRPAPASASREEIEAFHYVRRECIRALGAVGIPAVEMKPTVVDGVAVHHLLRVLLDAKDKNALSPPPSFTEKLEAALAIANLKYKDPQSIDPSNMYLPDAGIHMVGEFMKTFVKSYEQDWADFGSDKSLKPAIYWKGYAQRFWEKGTKDTSGALDNMVKQTKELPKSLARAKSILDGSKGMLEVIARDHGEVKGALNILDNPRPASASVFKKTAGAKFLQFP